MATRPEQLLTGGQLQLSFSLAVNLFSFFPSLLNYTISFRIFPMCFHYRRSPFHETATSSLLSLTPPHHQNAITDALEKPQNYHMSRKGTIIALYSSTIASQINNLLPRRSPDLNIPVTGEHNILCSWMRSQRIDHLSNMQLL